MSEFLAMGGYGAYVWTAYGVTALALLLLFLWSWFGARARETELEQVRQLSRADRRTSSSGTLRDAEPAVSGAAVTAGDARTGAD